MARCAALMILALVVSACASSYGPRKPTGGYHEQWIGETRFRVQFDHNGYTSEEMADALVLRRGAELALENGFRYVRIENLDARHPLLGAMRHTAEIALLDEATEDSRDAVEVIRETESFAGGRLSDRARRQLLDFEREQGPQSSDTPG